LKKCEPEDNKPKIIIDLFCLANTNIPAAAERSSQKGCLHSENGMREWPKKDLLLSEIAKESCCLEE
jgi:hypothetical protein